MFEIVKTRPGENYFNLFESFPKEIYSPESPFFRVSQNINTEYLLSCFLILENGKALCRAALYNNPHLKYDNKITFCIGNYECINEAFIADNFIKHIANYAKTEGAEYLIGPINGSTWDDYRFSIDHKHPNFFLEPYHHLYYNEQFTNFGFRVIANYHSSIETDLKFNNAAILQREQEFKQEGISFRNINLQNFENELQKIFDFNSFAFKSNFLYTPISKIDFLNKYQQTKQIVDPEFVVLAEDPNETLIGYFFCITDFHNKATKTLIAKTVARHPDKKYSGIGHVLGNIICKRALHQGYESIIHSFMHDQGTSLNMSQNFSGHIFKKYVLYGIPFY